MSLTRAAGSGGSFCEWKGRATYWDLTHSPSASSASGSETASGVAGATTQEPAETARARVWSYEDPTSTFAPIKGYLSFYVGPWSCWVDGEEARPQPGGFYGGWVTDEVVGTVKGGPGTWGW